MAPISQFTRTTPEAEGIPSAAVLSFVEALEQDRAHPLDAVHGFMLLRHGSVVAEGWWAPYGPQVPHSLYSLSKSFTSTAIGLAVAEGLLTVDDPVLKFFPDAAPADPSPNLCAMRVRHLLSMNTGHEQDTTPRVFGGADDNWPRTFLALPVEREPGSWFVYNTAATYMLSAIITQLTGMPLLDYLRPRLLDPLGIANPTWETDPRGINLGGTGLHLTTDDIARFGQLYLQQGLWQGQQLVPQTWIAEATAAHSDNSNTMTNSDWAVGYGYQFWRCRHNAYRGDGAFGQYCIVMPDQGAVLAINSGLRDMQVVLDKVWTHLLPAMQPTSLPANAEAQRALAARLAALTLPVAEGEPTAPNVEAWSDKTYTLEPNRLKLQCARLVIGDACNTLTLSDEQGDHALQIGYGTWLKGCTELLGGGTKPVAASGAWTADATYEVRLCFYAGELCPILRLRFMAGELQLDIDPNIAWEPPTVTTIIGRPVN